jgi:hypothetical protein
MIKEEKPTGFFEINLKIFPKGISSLIIHYSPLIVQISLLKTSTTSKNNIKRVSDFDNEKM